MGLFNKIISENIGIWSCTQIIWTHYVQGTFTIADIQVHTPPEQTQVVHAALATTQQLQPHLFKTPSRIVLDPAGKNFPKKAAYYNYNNTTYINPQELMLDNSTLNTSKLIGWLAHELQHAYTKACIEDICYLERKLPLKALHPTDYVRQFWAQHSIDTLEKLSDEYISETIRLITQLQLPGLNTADKKEYVDDTHLVIQSLNYFFKNMPQQYPRIYAEIKNLQTLKLLRKNLRLLTALIKTLPQ